MYVTPVYVIPDQHGIVLSYFLEEFGSAIEVSKHEFLWCVRYKGLAIKEFAVTELGHRV